MLDLLSRSVLERIDGDVPYVPKCVETATEVDYDYVPLSVEVGLLFRSVLERIDGDVLYVPKCVETATEVDYDEG